MKERANEKLCRCCDAFKAWKACLNWSQMGSCANLYTSGTSSSRSYRICLQTYQWRPCSTFIRVAVTIRRAVWVWRHLKTSYNILNCFVYRTSSFFILRETVRWQQHYSFLAKKEWCDTEIRFIISFKNWNKMFLLTSDLETTGTLEHVLTNLLVRSHIETHSKMAPGVLIWEESTPMLNTGSWLIELSSKEVERMPFFTQFWWIF